MSVTQKQVAERLNISRSLVTRALRGDPEVAEATRLSIAAAAKSMGYDPSLNKEARLMNARRHGQRVINGVAAVVFSPSPGVSIRSLPYSEPILEGMEAEAFRSNMDICFCPSRPDELPRLIRDRSVDGVIVLGYFPEYVASIRELGLPVVTFQTRYETAHSVTSDDRAGTREATRHLLKLGHRRIAYLGVHFVEGQPGEQRLLGYRDAMAEYGIPVPESWICSEFSGPFATPRAACYGCGQCAGCIGWPTLVARNALGHSAGQPPFTGLVCYSDAIAMASVEHMRKAGFEVPRDISVTGFDDTSLAYHFEPPLTSVAYAREEMGHVAVRLLHDAIQSDKAHLQDTECRHHVTPTHLVVRQSTGPLRVAS